MRTTTLTIALLVTIALGCSRAAVLRAQRAPALPRHVRRSRVVALARGDDDGEPPADGEDAAGSSYSTDWDAVRASHRLSPPCASPPNPADPTLRVSSEPALRVLSCTRLIAFYLARPCVRLPCCAGLEEVLAGRQLQLATGGPRCLHC